MELEEGEKVNIVIGEKTNLGYTVLVNNKYQGLIYNNDIFSDIEKGLQTKGYIKKIREDGKIDVSLRAQGFKNVINLDVDKILFKLQEKGYLMLTDKSSPESIKFHLQMSKKAFKRAIGSLYKKKIIDIKDNKILLLSYSFSVCFIFC